MNEARECNIADREALAERYLLGGMRKNEKTSFEEHLKACPFCAKKVQDNRKVITKLKNAAQQAGWDEKQLEQIDRLYSRGRITGNINWRLILKMAVIMILVVILPLTWWANREETKLAMLVTLERERALIEGETDASGELTRILTLHREGKDKQAVDMLTASLTRLEIPNEIATANRLLGLSYLFLDRSGDALSCLHAATITDIYEAEQLSYIYLAKAQLLMGNKLGAISALKKASDIKGNGAEDARALLSKIEQM